MHHRRVRIGGERCERLLPCCDGYRGVSSADRGCDAGESRTRTVSRAGRVARRNVSLGAGSTAFAALWTAEYLLDPTVTVKEKRSDLRGNDAQRSDPWSSPIVDSDGQVCVVLTFGSDRLEVRAVGRDCTVLLHDGRVQPNCLNIRKGRRVPLDFLSQPVAQFLSGHRPPWPRFVRVNGPRSTSVQPASNKDSPSAHL
jgi:hypothetical protein